MTKPPSDAKVAAAAHTALVAALLPLVRALARAAAVEELARTSAPTQPAQANPDEGSPR